MSQSETLTVNVVDNRDADQSSRRPRLRRPDRSLKIEISLDQLLDPDHRARRVWQFVEDHVDTRTLEAKVKAVEGVPGRNATRPALLVALWIYATLDGVTSGRELERRCQKGGSNPYQWLCGGVGVNYHLLDNFRTAHSDWLDQQMTALVALMQQEGLCRFEEPLGQDGMRTRAHAGSSSFRSPEALQQMRQEAQQRHREPDEHASPARQAAQERAVAEKLDRLQQACEAVEEVRAAKEARKKGDGQHARASTTDPQSRKMKMGDGGTRPAYNVQFGTLLGSLVIVGVRVSNSGSDANQMKPMLEHVEHQHRQKPQEACADGGFSSKGNVEAMQEEGVTLYCPLKEREKQLDKGKDPYQAKKGDSAALAAWRERMGTAEAQAKYKERCKCELPNAWCRNHGLGQFGVRGLQKVETVTKWFVLAYNLQRYWSLRDAQAQGQRAA